MNKKYLSISLRFILPILGGILLGIFSKTINNDFLVRATLTISDNVLVILKIITPFLFISMTASAFSKIDSSIKDKIKFLFKFFLIVLSTLLILGGIVFILSLIIVPFLTFGFTSSPSSFVDPFFKIPLVGVFQKQYYTYFQFFMLISGIILGIFLTKNNPIIKVLLSLESFIYGIFKYFLLPIMPFWILGSFAASTYANFGAQFILTDFALSIFILILQFSWLFIAYFLSAKFLNINFKKMLNFGLQIFGYVVSLTGMGTQIVLPFIIEKEKQLGFNEEKSTIITATSFNMPGSLISNIVFCIGVINIFNYSISTLNLFLFVLLLILVTVLAPPIPGGTMAISSTLMVSILGFSDEMIQIFSTMYYKQGTSNSAVNNASDLYISAFFKDNEQ